MADDTTAAGDSKALFEALEHARTSVIHRIDVRMKSLNFFIVLTGALVTGYMKPPSPDWLIIFPASGLISALLFFGLEIRGRQFQNHWGDQLEEVEQRVWTLAGLHWKPGTLQPRLYSHRWIYRALFGIVFIAWGAALLWGFYHR